MLYMNMNLLVWTQRIRIKHSPTGSGMRWIWESLETNYNILGVQKLLGRLIYGGSINGHMAFDKVPIDLMPEFQKGKIILGTYV